jgi:acetyl-CoA C-acetyltransferase
LVTTDRLPVILSGGQAIERENVVSAIDLAERAARAALDAVPGLDRRIQRVSVPGILSRGGPAPAARLAHRLRLGEVVTETTTVGGNTPQWLVNRAAADIAAGRLDATLIVGAEAIRSGREARSVGAPRPVADGPAFDPDPVVGDDRPGSGAAEMAAGLVLPAHVYPMLESVLAHRAGRDPAGQREFIAGWLWRFTAVAAAHPYAWFRRRLEPADIAQVSPDNRLVAEPYTKRMNAFLFGDQAAAVVVCSLGVARELGVADRAVFVWSGAQANDVWEVPARPDLGASPAIALAGRAALEAAGLGLDDVVRFDLYSCFPSAVELAAAALGLALDDPRGLTVTGGLPYFGGPGNNYSTHAIATMADLLRNDPPGAHGFVSALGWFVTKHAVGVYGNQPPPRGFSAPDLAQAQEAIDATALPVLTAGEGHAVVEAATVVFDREGSPTGAPVIATLTGGERVVAQAAPDVDLAALVGRDIVGERVTVAGSPPQWRPA